MSRMRSTRALVALFMLISTGHGLAQRLAVPRPAQLRVTVTYDGQSPVRDATVELQDAVGGSSAMDQKLTDQSGRAEFNTVTGMHRVRVTGADIIPYEGEIDIALTETYHFEPIRVQRKPGAAAAPQEPQGFIPAVRLKIPDNAQKEFEKGGRALEEKRWEAARDYFRAAINLYPDYDMAYNGLGSASYQLTDIAGARAAFEKAIELNDKFALAQRNLARILISEHHFDRAAALLNQSLATDPTNTWALTNAAYAELQLHRYKEAVDHALKVHTLPHEGLANAHVIAGYALDALGQREESLEQWKQYLKEDPKGLNAKKAEAEVQRLTKALQS